MRRRRPLGGRCRAGDHRISCGRILPCQLRPCHQRRFGPGAILLGPHCPYRSGKDRDPGQDQSCPAEPHCSTLPGLSIQDPRVHAWVDPARSLHRPRCTPAPVRVPHQATETGRWKGRSGTGQRIGGKHISRRSGQLPPKQEDPNGVSTRRRAAATPGRPEVVLCLWQLMDTGGRSIDRASMAGAVERQPKRIDRSRQGPQRGARAGLDIQAASFCPGAAPSIWSTSSAKAR